MRTIQNNLFLWCNEKYIMTMRWWLVLSSIIFLSLIDETGKFGKKVISYLNILFPWWQFEYKIIAVFLLKFILVLWLVTTFFAMILKVYLFIYSFCTKKNKEVPQELVYKINKTRAKNLWIIGPWGSGKTKLIKESLLALKKKYFYVSLFGLSNRSDIIKEINTQVVQASILSNLINIPVIGSLFGWIISQDGLQILKRFQDRILVLDDFERVGGTKNNDINIKDYSIYNEALGVIDYIEQEIGMKVIIITSNDGIEKLFDEVIVPKFYPIKYDVGFSKESIKSIAKSYLSNNKQSEQLSEIFSILWSERIDNEKNNEYLKNNYRPIINDLIYLSQIRDSKTIKSVMLSSYFSNLKFDLKTGNSINYEIAKLLAMNDQNKKVKKYLNNQIIELLTEDDDLTVSEIQNFNSQDKSIEFDKQILVAKIYWNGCIDNEFIYAINRTDIKILFQKDPQILVGNKHLGQIVTNYYLSKSDEQNFKLLDTIRNQRKLYKMWKEVLIKDIINKCIKWKKNSLTSNQFQRLVEYLQSLDTTFFDDKIFLTLIDSICNDNLNSLLENEETFLSGLLVNYIKLKQPEYEFNKNRIPFYLLENFIKYEYPKLSLPISDIRNKISLNYVSEFSSSMAKRKNHLQEIFESILYNMQKNPDEDYSKQTYSISINDLKIYKEHAYFFVMELEPKELIEGIQILDLLIKFLCADNQSYIPKLLSILENALIDDKGEEENLRGPKIPIYEEDGIFYDYIENVSARYNRWIDELKTLEKNIVPI